MSLEDYIRSQEQKLKNASQDVKEGWQNTKERSKQAGRTISDSLSNTLNG